MRCHLTFNADCYFLWDHSLKGPLILLGKINNGLYSVVQDELQASLDPSSPYKKACFTSTHSEFADLLHMRLGHISFHQLKLMFPSSNIQSHVNSHICHICPLAKTTRASFLHSSIKTTAAFQLLHIDVWGLYKVKTPSSCNQFLTIVDDFSRFTWIHLLKHKSVVSYIFEHFLNYVYNYFHFNVPTVRFDNALELTSGKMKDLFLRKGIINQMTCGYSPQQNGVVERKYRHLLETARSLYIQSQLPARFWGECVLCVAYLINRMPLNSIQNQTPYFRIFKSAADLDTLRCLVVCATLLQIRSTELSLNLEVHLWCLLDILKHTKGYKVLDLNTFQVTISRDVIFHEKHFPFHLSSSKSHLSYQSQIFCLKLLLQFMMMVNRTSSQFIRYFY